MNTKLLYLENMHTLACDAHVIDIIKENDKSVIILDQTVFYPQGGGQPYDTGIIKNASGIFRVNEVRFVDGIVKHIGTFEEGTFKIDNTVTCIINADRRSLNSRLHSAGHVIDMAVAQLNLNWTPGKGFHFPEGPYVEYAGSLEHLDKEKLQQDIQNICRDIIKQNVQTNIVFAHKDEIHKMVRFVPSNIPENKPTRVVMYGNFGVPCGGTHVAQLSDIKDITIRKIKMEKGAIRVAYDVPR